LGWQWVLFVNVPVGLAAAGLTPLFVVDMSASDKPVGFDLAGAISVTAGLVLLVYGIVKASDAGWSSAQTLGSVAGAAVLLAVFVVIERRSSAPLVRLGIFRSASLRIANAAALLTGAAMFSLFYFLSLYLQLVLDYSPLTTGFAYLPMALMVAISGVIAGGVVTRLGFKRVLVTGLGLVAFGLALLTQIRVDGVYPLDVLPASLTIAAGLGFTLVALTIAAMQGVDQTEMGLASGLVNASRQVGGALGLAVLSTIATSRFDALVRSASSVTLRSALVGGYHAAFLVGGVLAAFGAILVLALLSGSGTAETMEDEEPYVA
jgi:predicted MFS family arabinose efflux permease